jgi:protein-tyrosine phosphatase
VNSAPFRILTVCTGNICRSPMTERLLAMGLDSLSPGQFVVASAGTGALVGSPIDSRAAGYVRVFGGSSEEFAARQLTPALFEGQDLVLALTREHRGRIVEMAPALVRKTFTLRELARLLPVIDVDPGDSAAARWRAAVPKAVRARTANPADPGEDDVVDPYRRSDEVYQRMVRELVPAVDALVEWERRYHRWAQD